MNPALRLILLLVMALAISLPAQQPSNTNAGNASSPTVTAVQFSPDGKLLVTNSPDNRIQVWDVATGKPLAVALPQWGTWQLVSFKYGEAGQASTVPPDQKRLKLITEKHFTWVAYEVGSGKVQSMAGGTYTLSGETYTEKIEYAGEGMTEYIGKKQLFTVRVEGDRLHQSGTLSDGTNIEEVWRRVK